MTAFGTSEMAVAARKLGAEDVHPQAVRRGRAAIVVRDALANRSLREENLRCRREVARLRARPRVRRLEGDGHALRDGARDRATSSTVLITGESGTGKELVARAIHALSPRATARSSASTAAALPETLLESELFGHDKGAFTGASAQARAVRARDGGTLFLDEVGETRRDAGQAAARAAGAKRSGASAGTDETEVDVRVIAATNARSRSWSSRSAFREDLLPPAGDPGAHAAAARAARGHPAARRALHERFARQMGKRWRRISPDAMAAAERVHWPATCAARERDRARGRARDDRGACCRSGLPDSIRQPEPGEALPAIGDGFSLDAFLLSVEARLLRQALDRAAGDRREAARLLGVSARSLPVPDPETRTGRTGFGRATIIDTRASGQTDPTR
jgi:DNA-binding NtrC family response regulator